MKTGLKSLSVLLLLASAAACAQAPVPAAKTGAMSAPLSAPQVVQRYPYGSVQSVEMADQALEEVARTRRVIEDAFKNDEQACLTKFFASSCMDAAKERQRAGLAQIRQVEIEAKTFKRRARVVERDNALAEKAVEHEQDDKEREAAAVRKAAEAAASPKFTPTDAEVIAEQKKRAANIDAFDRKQRAAAQRQKEAEEKRVKREAERAAKEAREAEKAAKKAATAG